MKKLSITKYNVFNVHNKVPEITGSFLKKTMNGSYRKKEISSLVLIRRKRYGKIIGKTVQLHKNREFIGARRRQWSVHLGGRAERCNHTAKEWKDSRTRQYASRNHINGRCYNKNINKYFQQSIQGEKESQTLKNVNITELLVYTKSAKNI